MKIVKTILNLILSFLIIISISLIVATNILENKILDKNYMNSKLEETEFYLQIYREVENGFENYIYQSGLPEDTIKDIFTDEMIKNDVSSIINKVYEGTDIKLSSETVRQNLDNKINDYLNSQNIKLNKQGKSNITEFENLIIKEYDNNVNASETLYQNANNGINFLNKINNIIGNYPIIATIVIIILLIAINFKNLLNVINYVGISILSLGTLIKLGVNLIFKNIKLDDLVILKTSLSNLIINISKDILYTLSDKGTLFIFAGIVAIIVVAVMQNTGKKAKKD